MKPAITSQNLIGGLAGQGDRRVLSDLPATREKTRIKVRFPARPGCYTAIPYNFPGRALLEKYNQDSDDVVM